VRVTVVAEFDELSRIRMREGRHLDSRKWLIKSKDLSWLCNRKVDCHTNTSNYRRITSSHLQQRMAK